MPVKIERGFNPMTDRYAFDFRTCTFEKGWAQLDTKQDASYHGTWVSPSERKLVNYCEGDITVTSCDTDEEFVATVRETCQWHDERGHGPARIDCLYPQDNEVHKRLEALGLSDLVH